MQIPYDTIVKDKDLLTEKYNVWRDQLMERVAQWKQAELEKSIDPSKVFRNKDGQTLSVLDVVEVRKAQVREAVQYVKILKTLLEACEAGSLEDVWKDEDLKPLQKLHLPTKKDS